MQKHLKITIHHCKVYNSIETINFRKHDDAEDGVDLKDLKMNYMKLNRFHFY